MARFSSVPQLRQALGPDWADASDEEVLSSVATANNMDPTQLARRLGYGDLNAGKWGNRFSASGDNWQAGMYGVGEAAAGALGAQGAQDWFSRRRQDNELAANVARARAADQGAVSSYKDIGGVGDFFDYAGGLAVDSAPYFAEAAAGALVGGATLPATAARMGVRLGAPAARMAGMAGASYPSAVGDILQNQRETGQPVDLGMAAAGGVPYAALNLLGPESTLARGTLFRNAWRGLDNIPGVRGAAARTAGTFATQGVMEGIGETGQEGVNQFFGRMAVDPNEQFFSPDAVERYGESFVGGATLGGMVGGALGGWRRGQYPEAGPAPQPQPPPPPVTEQPGGDLLGLPWNGYFTQGVPPSPGAFIAGMGPEATTYTPGDLASYDPTRQGELFPSSEVPPAAPYVPYSPREGAAPAPVDTQTADMFVDRPDATVQTDFNVQQVLRELAAVTDGKAPDSWTVKLATAISREIANPKLRAALAQERKKYERFFGHDPTDEDGWTFDSQEQMDKVFTRLYQLDAAEAIVDRYYQRMTDAQVQAAAARGAQGGYTQEAPAQTTGSEEDIRARNAVQAQDEAIAETDARVASGRQDQVDKRRQAILDEVLGDPATTNARGRFTARLKKQGITDTALRPSEVARIDRWVESRAAFAEPTQGELNFGDVAPGQTQDVVPPSAPAPAPQVEPKGQLKLFKRLPNAVQARSPETRTSQAVAPVVPEGQAAVPGEQAPAAKKGRARQVTYTEYNNIAVTLPAKPGVAAVDRKVLNVGERLRELDGKASKYRQLIACLSQ